MVKFIVNGSSRGIGNAIATKLASVGSNLIINGISDSEFLENEASRILRSTESMQLLVLATYQTHLLQIR